MPDPFKIFFDTEFLEHKNRADFEDRQRYGVEAVSIGLVTENGTRLYIVFNDFDEKYGNEWTRKHVLSKLPPMEERYSSREASDVIGNWLTIVSQETEADEIQFLHRKSSNDPFILCRTLGGEDAFAKFMSFIGFKNYSFRDTDELRRATPYCQPSEQPEATKHISIEDAVWEKIEYDERINFLRYNPELARRFSAPAFSPV